MSRIDEFDTTRFSDAEDQAGELVKLVGQSGDGKSLRDRILELHGVAMSVVNNGHDHRLDEMISLASDIEDDLNDVMSKVDAIQSVISDLLQLDPDFDDT